MVDLTKSYLLDRVADLSSDRVILSELKSYLSEKSKQTGFSDFSLSCLIILDKVRQLEYKYKGVK